jgi:mevalonate kinase
LQIGEYYSKGKFLLSGEYAVLHGAKALAVPLKFGQKMITSGIPGKNILIWETTVLNKPWFTAVFEKTTFQILSSSDINIALFLKKILEACGELNPDLKSADAGFLIRNEIDFDINWGLGSSSSLLSNLAYWLDVDPFRLYKKIFRGSGFDVYCARAEGPIVYRIRNEKPEVVPARFNPHFTDHIFFAYLGKKQDSQVSVNNFLSGKNPGQKVLQQISELTDRMVAAASLPEFLVLMKSHEQIMSELLGIPMIKPAKFDDFDGEIKSLGAWGGDFVMAATAMTKEDTKDYFRKRNMPVVFQWKEIVFNVED